MRYLRYWPLLVSILLFVIIGFFWRQESYRRWQIQEHWRIVHEQQYKARERMASMDAAGRLAAERQKMETPEWGGGQKFVKLRRMDGVVVWFVPHESDDGFSILDWDGWENESPARRTRDFKGSFERIAPGTECVVMRSIGGLAQILRLDIPRDNDAGINVQPGWIPFRYLEPSKDE